MKYTKISFFTLLVFFLCSQTLIANEKYEKYATEIRESIWAWDKPEFTNYTVPEKYKDESAVIMALHEDVYATGNTKLRFTGGGVLGFGLNKELTYVHILRKMVKLNDKRSLEDNSEIEFSQSSKSFGFNVSTKYTTVVGVRIIKPNGTINEVDINEAVSLTEGKKEKETSKKLAIPNLEVGDILDFFIHEEGRIDYQNIPEQIFIFAAKYPVLSYSVHCVLDKNLTTEYRLINDAPDFTETISDDGDYILDVKKTNIEKVSTERWLSPLRQFPTISLSVLYNSNNKIYKPASARKKGLYKNLPAEQILEDAMNSFNGASYYMYAAKDIHKQTKKYKKENPQADNKQIAEYINQALLEYTYGFDGLNHRVYLATLGMLYKKHKIEYKLGVVTNRFSVRPEDTTGYWDYSFFILANDGSQLITPPMYFYYIGTNPSFEGETAELIIPKKYNQINFSDQSKRSKYNVPVSTANQNVNKTEMNVRLDESNFLTLDINRKTTLSGQLRNGVYSDIILASDWRNDMKKWMNEKTYLEKLQEKGKTKDIDAYEEVIKQQLKNQKEKAKDEVKYFHDIDVNELKEYSIPSLGVTPDQPELVYETHYTLDGLVKRAGNNYILDAGKLIGSQLVLNEDDKKRTVDVYMPYARSYEYEIRVDIPQGYSVENLSSLNQSVDNECGAFLSNASIEGAALVLKVKKTYKNNFEKVENWSQLSDMINLTNTFYGQSVVFKK